MGSTYTVKQLARLAGTTVRTLHHYDQIGLLKPASVGKNRYRYYGEAALYRLQHILFYRQLGMRLRDIKRIVGGPDFDTLKALQTHRASLQTEVKRIHKLIRTIDLTTSRLKGARNVNDSQLFGGFTDEEQERMADEASRRWDAATVRASGDRWKKYSSEKRKRILDEGSAIYRDLTSLMPADPSDPKVQSVVHRWHEHMQYFWSPTDEQLIGLADLYNEDSRFGANFEAMKPGLAAFMRAAVREYVRNRQ